MEIFTALISPEGPGKASGTGRVADGGAVHPQSQPRPDARQGLGHRRWDLAPTPTWKSASGSDATHNQRPQPARR